MFPLLLDKHLGMGLLNHRVSPCFTSEGTARLRSQVIVRLTSPTRDRGGCQLPCILTNRFHLGCVVALTCISLVTKDTEHLFYVLFGHLHTLLCDVNIQIF